MQSIFRIEYSSIPKFPWDDIGFVLLRPSSKPDPASSTFSFQWPRGTATGLAKYMLPLYL